MSGPYRNAVVLAGLSLLALAVLCLSPLLGIVTLTPGTIMADETLRYIFFSMRLPRLFTAFLAGGGLAVAGLVYQAIFRNPLADPYTLGVSSGASLGAAICILAGAGGSLAGMSVVTMASFAGALASIAVIYCFAWSREANSSTLLLAGVILATLCSGLIMFIHFIGGLEKSFQILRWIMGGVDGVSFGLMAFMIAPLAFFLAVSGAFMPQLDHFLTGDSIAHSRGVNVRASRNLFISITAVAVGGIVAVCGPIGFIGIIAPHACRILMPGSRHRLLGLASFLLGGTFLVAADTLARSIVPPSEIPVGIVTALLGGPFFLLLLLRRKNKLLV